MCNVYIRPMWYMYIRPSIVCSKSGQCGIFPFKFKCCIYPVWNLSAHCGIYPISRRWRRLSAGLNFYLELGNVISTFNVKKNKVDLTVKVYRNVQKLFKKLGVTAFIIFSLLGASHKSEGKGQY